MKPSPPRPAKAPRKRGNAAGAGTVVNWVNSAKPIVSTPPVGPMRVSKSSKSGKVTVGFRLSIGMKMALNLEGGFGSSAVFKTKCL